MSGKPRSSKTVKSTKANSKLNKLLKQIKADSEARKEERKVAILSTPTGVEDYFKDNDSKRLDIIMKQIEAVTEKPVYKGFGFHSNVEKLVAICSALQYMKGNLRENIDSTLWEVFSDDRRDSILEAYGRLPYLAKPTLIEVDGQVVNVDPDAVERAKAGVPANVQVLEPLVNSLALHLNLDAEYTLTQSQADRAWNSAVKKMQTAEILDEYKESLQEK